MSHTCNGRYIGQAAAAHNAEVREYIQDEEAEARRKRCEAIEREWMLRCIAVEGYSSFEAWYDSDAVPAYGSYRSRIEMIQKRIEEIHARRIARENGDVQKSL